MWWGSSWTNVDGEKGSLSAGRSRRSSFMTFDEVSDSDEEEGESRPSCSNRPANVRTIRCPLPELEFAWVDVMDRRHQVRDIVCTTFDQLPGSAVLNPADPEDGDGSRPFIPVIDLTGEDGPFLINGQVQDMEVFVPLPSTSQSVAAPIDMRVVEDGDTMVTRHGASEDGLPIEIRFGQPGSSGGFRSEICLRRQSKNEGRGAKNRKNGGRGAKNSQRKVRMEDCNLGNFTSSTGGENE